MFLCEGNFFVEHVIVVDVIVTFGIGRAPLIADGNSVVGDDSILIIFDSLKTRGSDVVRVAVIVGGIVEI